MFINFMGKGDLLISCARLQRPGGTRLDQRDLLVMIPFCLQAQCRISCRSLNILRVLLVLFVNIAFVLHPEIRLCSQAGSNCTSATSYSVRHRLDNMRLDLSKNLRVKGKKQRHGWQSFKQFLDVQLGCCQVAYALDTRMHKCWSMLVL